jgi:hypothetical protein
MSGSGIYFRTSENPVPQYFPSIRKSLSGNKCRNTGLQITRSSFSSVSEAAHRGEPKRRRSWTTFLTKPIYAERGITTFPVRIDENGKRPAVKGYLKLGPTLSRKLAKHFSDAEALGFVLGVRSGLTVLDIDTAEERIVADAFDRHGLTPIIVRTGSGNFQGWYRHAAERRLIRPTKGIPIDILGRGFVVAPPSVGQLGNYQFVQGGLNDLGSLPVLRNAPAGTYSAALSSPAAPPGIGDRNNKLFRLCMKSAPACDDAEALADYARTQNADFEHPLDEQEVMTVVGSAWSYEEQGRNYLGIGRFVQVSHLEIESLTGKSGDALILLMLLRVNHWGRDFVIANAMAETMPGGCRPST